MSGLYPSGHDHPPDPPWHESVVSGVGILVVAVTVTPIIGPPSDGRHRRAAIVISPDKKVKAMLTLSYEHRPQFR